MSSHIHKAQCLLVTAIAIGLLLVDGVLGNNPDGTNPYWNGPSGEVVDMFSGELILPTTDVSIPARGGMSISFTRTYNSELVFLRSGSGGGRALSDGYKLTPPSLSVGWHMNVPKIVLDDNMIVYPDGQYEEFFRDSSSRLKTRQFAVATHESTDSLVLSYPGGSRMVFGVPKDFGEADTAFEGRYLRRVYDNTGLNWLTYSYYHEESGPGVWLKQIEDNEGRYIRLGYLDNDTLGLGANKRIASVSYKGHGDSVRTINYIYTTISNSKMLTAVAYPNGDTISYSYDNHYYNGDNSYVQLLKSVTYPTGAKVKYLYEPFEQRTIHCLEAESTITLSSQNFAVKYVIFDSSGVDIDTVRFIRSYSGEEGWFTSQYAESCDECTSSQGTVHEFQFYQSSTEACSPEPGLRGLLSRVRIFKGTLTGGLCGHVSGNPDEDEYWERYWDSSVDAELTGCRDLRHGWELLPIGTLVEDTIRYPHLLGYEMHVANTSFYDREYPTLGAGFDTRIGMDTAYCVNGEREWQIKDSYYNSTHHRYLAKVVRFDDFDTRYDYDSTTTPWTPLLKRIYNISIVGARDSVGSGFAYDAYGNVVMTWDNFAIEAAGRWIDSTGYDATHTFPVSSTTRYGLSSRSWIDANLGQVDSSDTPTGARVRYSYDSADRLLNTQRAGDPDISMKLTYDAIKRVSQAEALAVPGSPSVYRKTKSWTDIWGRAIADTTFDYQGTGVHKISRTEYNRLGQVRKSFRPWQSNESDSAMVATKFKYDFLGRVKEVDSPNTQDDSSNTFQNVVTKQYFARDVTTTSWDGKKHKSRMDKYGRLTDSYFDSTGGAPVWRDHGYTQYFGVTSLPVKVFSPADDSILYTYDRWRNVRSVTKKDEGTSYSYTDKRGNLRFAQDANAQWSFFEYDSLSRLIKVGVAQTVDTMQLEDMSYQGTSPTTKVTYFYGRYDNPPDTVADTLNGYYGTSGTNYNSVAVIKGMLTQVNDEACKTFFVYDQFGRTLSKIIYFNPVEVWPGAWTYPGVKIVDYKYNVADQIDQIRYPRETNFMAYRYYPSGLLKRVPKYIEVAADTTQAAFNYRAWGAVSWKQNINGLWETFTFDSLSRIQKIAMDGDGGALAFGESYSYYNQYLTKIYSDSLANTLRSGPRRFFYTYDYRGRLDSTRYFDGMLYKSTKYGYDGANNRRSSKSLLQTYYNLYLNSNKLKNTSSSASDTTTRLTYNSKGNTLRDLALKREYRYDYRDMIDTIIQKYSQDTTKADTLTFAYNYKNQRVMKLVKYWYRRNPCLDPELLMGEDVRNSSGGGGGDTLPQPLWCDLQGVKATFYVWSGDEVIAEYNYIDALLDQYVIANGERVARLHWTGVKKDTTFLHHDRQGTLRMVTWRSGPAPSKMTFDPWGELLAQSGSEGVAYTYTGQEWDEESNMRLFYLRNRYYDPSLGRFLTPDPLVSDLNPYSYCNNNPVMMSDPLGLNPKPGEPAPGDPDYVDPNYVPRLNANGDEYLTPGKSHYRSINYRRIWTSAGSVGGVMVQWEAERIKMHLALKVLEQQEARLKERARKLKSKWDKEAGGDGKWRPDSDGYISREEAFVWWKLGNGQELSMSLNSLDFSGVSIADMNPVGKPTGVDLFYSSDEESSKFVFGGLSITLQEDGTVISSLGYDTYQCEGRPHAFYDAKETFRDVACSVWWWEHGIGTPFKIRLTGSVDLGE